MIQRSDFKTISLEPLLHTHDADFARVTGSFLYMLAPSSLPPFLVDDLSLYSSVKPRELEMETPDAMHHVSLTTVSCKRLYATLLLGNPLRHDWLPSHPPSNHTYQCPASNPTKQR